MENTETKLFNRNFILISAASLLMFTGFYLVMPIIAKYVVEEFHADSSTAGLVAASYIITALLTRPFSGYLVDKFDRKKFYMIAFSLFSIMFTGYVISDSIGGLVLTRIFLGASFALVTTASNTIAIDVLPSNRRADGIGYYGAIIVLAMAAGPMLGLYMVEIFTYRELFIFACCCCWVGVAIGAQVKTRHREPVKHETMSIDRFFLREGLSIATVISLMYFLYGSLMVFVSLYVQHSGISVNPGNFFMYFALGIIIARGISGNALHHGKHDIILKVGTLLIIGAGTLLTLYLTAITFPIAAIILGVGFGMIAPAVQSMIIDLVPSNRRGTANSTYFIALDFGSGIGMLAGGWIAHSWSYGAIFGFGVVLTIVSLLFYCLYARHDYQHRLELSKKK